jgi:hypothetical protein
MLVAATEALRRVVQPADLLGIFKRRGVDPLTPDRVYAGR